MTYIISHTVNAWVNEQPAYLHVQAFTLEGLLIGQCHIKVDHDPEGAYIVSHGIHVDELYQRKGIASQMYVYAEEVTKLTLIPAFDQTTEGKALWASKNRCFGLK